MSWDRISAARKFLQMANAIHPEEADKDEHVHQLASQDLYYECYVASFSREKLLEFLQGAIAGGIKVPENVDPKKYRAAYASQADALLKKITDDAF